MLEPLVSGLLSLFFSSGSVNSLEQTHLSDWLDTVSMQTWIQPQKVADPVAVNAVEQHLQAIAPLGMATSVQGVWLQSGSDILADSVGEQPLPAASLTKIPTTLAALSTWPPDHQFETVISTVGTLANGTLEGDLVVQGSDDPFLVWEEAIAIANALQQMGIQRVTGNLVVTNNLVMNFQPDPQQSGELLKQGFNAALWNSDAATQYATLPPNTPKPNLAIDGVVKVVTADAIAQLKAQPVLRHQSLPLVDILRAMNIYSNNVMANRMADAVGGAQVAAQKAAQAANLPPAEILLVNGSGLGIENRISPRAVVTMLMTIQQVVKPYGFNVTDLFPVIGRDRGTLAGRNLPIGSAVKTGTLNEVSSLAGVVLTRDRGPVWFSIINVGTGELSQLHAQQDRLLHQIVATWGNASPVPPEFASSDRSNPTQLKLGDPQRNTRL